MFSSLHDPPPRSVIKLYKSDESGPGPDANDLQIAYFAELIEDKMKRAKTNWMNAQQKFNEDGKKEMIESHCFNGEIIDIL